jgi:hypothetical protein
LVLVISLLFFSTVTKAQSDHSSSSIVMTVSEKDKPGVSELSVRLVEVNLATGEYRNLFTDQHLKNVNALRALQWSPDGNLLAIGRFEEIDGGVGNGEQKFLSQICVLTKQGALQTCAEDSPFDPQYSGVENQAHVVTWSADGSSIYFVIRENDTLRLVEADASTGKRKRSVYELDLTGLEIYPLVHWTPDLDYMLVGAGNDQGVYVAYTVSLANSRQYPLAPQERGLKTTPRIACPQFSPQGSYVAMLDYPNNSSSFPQILDIVDKQGGVIHRIDGAQVPGLRSVNCGIWAADESAFYFPATVNDSGDRATARWYRYTLATQNIALFYEAQPNADGSLDPISISPDDGRTVILPRQPVEAGRLSIVYAGTATIFDFPFSRFAYPLWVPPLK